jgi:hypothetical protein
LAELASPALTLLLPIEVERVDGVGTHVLVVVTGAAADGVHGEEASGHRVVEPDTHEGKTAWGVGRPLLHTEPAVTALPDGGGVAGVAVFIGGAIGRRQRADAVARANDVAVEVGELVGGGAGDAVVDD